MFLVVEGGSFSHIDFLCFVSFSFTESTKRDLKRMPCRKRMATTSSTMMEKTTTVTIVTLTTLISKAAMRLVSMLLRIC